MNNENERKTKRKKCIRKGWTLKKNEGKKECTIMEKKERRKKLEEK